MTALLCRLGVLLLPPRNGFVLPAAPVSLEKEAVEMGMVVLLLAGVAALLAMVSELDICCGVDEGKLDGVVPPNGLESSRMVGIGWGAR